MSETNPEFWLSKLRDPLRREEAASKIFQFYYERLLREVQPKLAHQFAGRFDSEDVVQSAFKSFFRRDYEIPDQDSLIALLRKICDTKAKSKIRRHQQEKRDVRRESPEPNVLDNNQRCNRPQDAKGRAISADPDASFSSLAGDEEIMKSMASGVTAEQSAMFIEMIQSLPPELQQIFCWRLAGLTEQEIARQLGRTRRTVTRKLALIYRCLDE